MSDDLKKYTNVIISLSLNVAASCGTIFINKFIFKSYQFTFGTLLTVCHFIITFLLTWLCGYFEVFKIKKLPIRRVLPISFAFCGYVVFNNLSLMYNSVSFYQVSKIACTPVIIAVQWFLYKQKTSVQTWISLIPVCLGIFITVVTDMELNLLGSFMAGLAVLSNSMYTIYGKTKLQELKAEPMQLLLYQSSSSAIILSGAIFIFDDYAKIPEYNFTVDGTAVILLSCLTAFMVNFSFFLLSKHTSPLTVNVVGYFKTVIVFIGGWLLFDQQLNAKNIIGIILTLGGLAGYTYVKIQEDQARIRQNTKKTDIASKV